MAAVEFNIINSGAVAVAIDTFAIVSGSFHIGTANENVMRAAGEFDAIDAIGFDIAGGAMNYPATLDPDMMSGAGKSQSRKRVAVAGSKLDSIADKPEHNIVAGKIYAVGGAVQPGAGHDKSLAISIAALGSGIRERGNCGNSRAQMAGR
jgi:hypothetical protein